MTLQHVVLFAFPEELSETDSADMRRQVERWPEAIGGINRLRFGSDLTGERTRGYQYLLFTMFPSAEALAAYVAHPVHQQLLRFLDERSCTRLAFDYYV